MRTKLNHPAQYAPEPVRLEMPSSLHKRTKKFNRQKQITNAADVAVSFRRTLRNVDSQRRAVQHLRDAARDMHKRRNQTTHQLSLALSSLLKLLEDANLHTELRGTISDHIVSIEARLKEVEDQGFTFDGIQEELDSAEHTLKQMEIALYEQILWPIEHTESEVETLLEVPSILPNGQEEESIDTSVNYPTIVHVPSTNPLEAELREEVLIPLEYIQMDTEQWMSGQNLKSDSGADENHNTHESYQDTGHTREIPQYIEALVAGPTALEERPLTAAADRLSRYLARQAHLKSRLSKAQADYVILQEDADRRMAVGVALDFFSQQYLDAYPDTCKSLGDELSFVEAQIAVCRKAVECGDNQIPRVSQIFFHMDQFSDISTNDRPTELVIDGGDDLEAQWETFEALASDLWPVSSTIPYPKHAKNWMSLTLDIMRTHKEFLYAYVSFWVLKCLQASWLSFSRFIYYHYLDDMLAPNYKSLKKRLLRSWFDKDLTMSVRTSQDRPAGYPAHSSLLTAPVDFDEKIRENLTKSPSSVGAQVDATFTPQKSTTSRKGERSVRKVAHSITRSLLNGRWRPRDDYARTR